MVGPQVAPTRRTQTCGLEEATLGTAADRATVGETLASAAAGVGVSIAAVIAAAVGVGMIVVTSAVAQARPSTQRLRQPELVPGEVPAEVPAEVLGEVPAEALVEVPVEVPPLQRRHRSPLLQTRRLARHLLPSAAPRPSSFPAHPPLPPPPMHRHSPAALRSARRPQA